MARCERCVKLEAIGEDGDIHTRATIRSSIEAMSSSSNPRLRSVPFPGIDPIDPGPGDTIDERALLLVNATERGLEAWTAVILRRAAAELMRRAHEGPRYRGDVIGGFHRVPYAPPDSKG